MSAYVVDHCHITAILNSLAPRYPGDSISYYHHGKMHPTGGRHHDLAQILVDQNVRSVNHRYDENDPPPPYHYAPSAPTLTPNEAISLCHGYSYQACETPDYQETEAYSIITCIRERAIRNLPGYDEAPWTLYQHDLDERVIA